MTPGPLDSAHHSFKRFCAGDFFEFGGIERVEADVHAPQARRDEPIDAFGQQMAVRCDRQVFDAECGKPPDVILDAFAHQRLATRDANFANAKI